MKIHCGVGFAVVSILCLIAGSVYVSSPSLLICVWSAVGFGVVSVGCLAIELWKSGGKNSQKNS